MLRKHAGFTAQDGAEAVGCRDIVIFSDLFALSIEHADGDAEEAAAN